MRMRLGAHMARAQRRARAALAKPRRLRTYLSGLALALTPLVGPLTRGALALGGGCYLYRLERGGRGQRLHRLR